MAALNGSGQILRHFLLKLHTYRPLTCSKRLYSVTGNEKADKVLTTVTGGRIDGWLQKYEDAVGLTEIKEAQDKVIQAEAHLLQVQSDRRKRQVEMQSVQSKLKQISMDLDKVQRGDERYLKLLTEEHEILKEDSRLSLLLENFEEDERLLFAELSSAVRESHEKERSRSDRTKYWSIIGSIIGAAIGITGTSINNYLRMRELRGLVRESTGESVREDVAKVADSVQTHHGQMIEYLKDLKIMHGIRPERTEGEVSSTLDEAGTKSLEHIEQQTHGIYTELQKQDELLQKELKALKTIVGAAKAEGAEGNVVYVGPELEQMFETQNKNIEWKIKMNALWTTTLIYGAFALTLPVLYGIFKGG